MQPHTLLGMYSRHYAHLDHFARNSPRFKRETISGLSLGQKETLRSILGILDRVHQNKTHNNKTVITIVGFGGTGKHQLMRILKEYFSDPSNGHLTINFQIEQNASTESADVVITSSLPFDTKSNQSCSTAHTITHKGFSASELYARLIAFDISHESSSLICQQAANYGFGSFALALGLTLSPLTPLTIRTQVLHGGIALGMADDTIAKHLLSIHPTIKNIATSGTDIEEKIAPFIPPYAERFARATIRRVIRDELSTISLSASSIEALTLSQTSYASFNQLARILLETTAGRGITTSSIIKITAKLPVEIAAKINALADDDALSHDSRLKTLATVLISMNTNECIARQDTEITEGVSFPPIAIKEVMRSIGFPRLSLLLGAIFDALQRREVAISCV